MIQEDAEIYCHRIAIDLVHTIDMDQSLLENNKEELFIVEGEGGFSCAVGTKSCL